MGIPISGGGLSTTSHSFLSRRYAFRAYLSSGGGLGTASQKVTGWVPSLLELGHAMIGMNLEWAGWVPHPFAGGGTALKADEKMMPYGPARGDVKGRGRHKGGAATPRDSHKGYGRRGRPRGASLRTD